MPNSALSAANIPSLKYRFLGKGFYLTKPMWRAKSTRQVVPRGSRPDTSTYSKNTQMHMQLPHSPLEDVVMEYHRGDWKDGEGVFRGCCRNCPR